MLHKLNISRGTLAHLSWRHNLPAYTVGRAQCLLGQSEGIPKLLTLARETWMRTGVSGTRWEVWMWQCCVCTYMEVHMDTRVATFLALDGKKCLALSISLVSAPWKLMGLEGEAGGKWGSPKSLQAGGLWLWESWFPVMLVANVRNCFVSNIARGGTFLRWLCEDLTTITNYLNHPPKWLGEVLGFSFA